MLKLSTGRLCPPATCTDHTHFLSGMIAAMTRHLRSLRLLRRDHGWIHTLLEEAENERMHLLTALTLRNPGQLFRAAIIASQGTALGLFLVLAYTLTSPPGAFVSMFWLAYVISPQFCHRFVGYLEEEAVKTYTHCLEVLYICCAVMLEVCCGISDSLLSDLVQCIDAGKLPMWAKMPAPPVAVKYWKLAVR